MKIKTTKKLIEAATIGTLSEMPKKFLTEENLLKEDELGHSAFRCAIIYRHLKQIPLGLITEKNLQIEDNGKWNGFHEAAYRGCLNQIPKEFLTPKNLLYGNEFKEAPLYLVFSGKQTEMTLILQLFTPQQCVKHLSALKKIKAALSMRWRKEYPELEELIAKTKAFKNLQRLPSLKI